MRRDARCRKVWRVIPVLVLSCVSSLGSSAWAKSLSAQELEIENARIYLDHSGVTSCIETLRRMRIRPRSLLVLGTATGEVLGDFERAFRVRAFGCEVSRWAHARIPAHFRRRIRRADLRRYVPELARAEKPNKDAWIASTSRATAGAGHTRGSISITAA